MGKRERRGKESRQNEENSKGGESKKFVRKTGKNIPKSGFLFNF
jgi:hypothetical protein